MMHDSGMRVVMTEILNEITHPKQIKNLECLKLIADVIRFVLTLFVHEEGADYRLLSAILDCSQNLYYQHNRRKQTIAYYLVDHGIWCDTGAWRECIEETLKMRMREQAIRL